ncbi:MAG: hypothetical protein E6J20_01180 [Chloroflexi bacterium]|nr:MAG: hypothetical protein E6J20_01180 [Chloroflexota bacterium]
MTFKHKLSVRLALLKDVLPLVPLLGLLAACEQASMLAPPIKTNINVSTIVTVPASVNLDPGQSLQFASYGRTPAGDSVDINVTWQAVGGGLISASGLYTAGTLQGDYAVKATLIPPAAIGAPVVAVPMQTSVVHVDPVAQIVVVPASTSVVTGGTQQFAAYGLRSTGDSVALSVVWSATGGTISSSGLYTAGAMPGGYVVTAMAGGLSGTATVTASSTPVDSVIVTPPDSVNLSVGSTQQFTAVVRDASGNVLTGRTVTWETSNSAVATVSPSGLVTGVGVGSATITATSGGKKGHGNAKVSNLPVASVTLSPSPATVYVGATMQLVATLKDANGHPLSGRTVTWTTSDGTVATVDGTGLVTGIALGATTITATSEGQTGVATVTVSSVPVASVVVAPSIANILVGNTVQLTATTQDAAGTVLAGRAITWSSSNPSVATVSPTGLTTGVAAGTATITATSEGKNASAAVTVANVPVASVVISPATALVLVGASVQLVASPKDAAGNLLSGRAITWTSSAPATATVSPTGLVTGVGAGAVTITAMSEGMTGSAAVTVNPVPVASVSLSPATVSAAVGQAVQLTATPRDASGNPLSGRVVTWATSNAAVATVTASGQVTVGVVTGVAAGSATITATSEGKSTTATVTVTTAPVASVAVTPATATIAAGGNQQFSAVTRDAAGNTLTGRVVTWASSNPTVATVSSGGLVTGQATGSATITAASEGKSGTAGITVQALPPGTHTGHYVAPNGSSTGDGTTGKPWDLATALAQPSAVQPGDTIWLRAGTYGGAFTSRLTGTDGAPVIVRQYPGERATIDGNLVIGGAYTWYWGFEVMSSVLNPIDLIGVNVQGPGTKCINMISHDNGGNGFGFWMPAVNSEIYGSIVYNNGRQTAVSGYAHGIYTQNETGTKLIRDNVLFNQFGKGIMVYGSLSAFLNNYDIEGNISFDNGSPVGGANPDILVGGTVPATGISVQNNMTYQQAGGASVWFGWTDAQNADLVAQNNYMAGQVLVVNWNSIIFTNNGIYHANKLDLRVPTATVPAYSWDNNDYVMTTVNDVWGGPFGAIKAGVAANYSTLGNWQAATGLDAHSAALEPASGKPTGVRVFIRPNAYERGRANIAIYNWDQAATVLVDLSSILQLSDSFEVHNVQDFFGPAVVKGRYNGGSVQLPMAGIQPPAPIGRSSLSPVTGPTFNAFVLLRTGP